MATAQTRNEGPETGKVFRAKVTGRHAITLPAELCRQLKIRVGDSVELKVEDGVAVLRPIPILPISALRGILKPYFPDSVSIQEFLEEERSGWDEREERLDRLWDRKWPQDDHSDD